MSILNQAGAALNDSVLMAGGVDAAMNACNRVYSELLRSEPFKLSNHEDWGYCPKDLCKDVYGRVAQALYSKETGGTQCGFDFRAVDWMKENHPEFEVTGDTLVVDFCNYKGEQEGDVGLFELNKHLNIFAM